MSPHNALWWKAEVFNAEQRWVNGSEVPAKLAGSSLPISLDCATELSIEAEWLEYLQHRARSMRPSFVAGNWRYEEAKEPLVNFQQTEVMEHQSLSASIILPAGSHEIHFEARSQYIGAPIGAISISHEAPFRMAVTVKRRLNYGSP